MRARVLEDLHAVLCECRWHLVVVIMITEDGEDTVRRRQRRQRIGGRAHILPVSPCHIVAAEDNQIRLFRHQLRHGVRDVVVGHPAAAMNIRQQADPQPDEGGGKARYTDRLPRHPQLMARVEKTVGTRSRGGADAGRHEPFEHCAARDECHACWPARRLGTGL